MLSLEEINKSYFSLELLKGEEFRDCLGFDGMYSISNYGRVRSERRERPNGGFIKPRIIKPFDSGKQMQLNLYVNNKPRKFELSKLIANSFLDPAEGFKTVAMHKNKNYKDNRLINIEVVSKSVSCKASYNNGSLDVSIDKMAQRAIERGKERYRKFGIYENGEIKGYICTRCFQEKETSEYLHTNTFCKQCLYKSQGTKDIGKISRRKELSVAGLQECSKCKNALPLSKFYKSKDTKLGVKSSCMDCN